MFKPIIKNGNEGFGIFQNEFYWAKHLHKPTQPLKICLPLQFTFSKKATRRFVLLPLTSPLLVFLIFRFSSSLIINGTAVAKFSKHFKNVKQKNVLKTVKTLKFPSLRRHILWNFNIDSSWHSPLCNKPIKLKALRFVGGYISQYENQSWPISH